MYYYDAVAVSHSAITRLNVTYIHYARVLRANLFNEIQALSIVHPFYVSPVDTLSKNY